MATRKASNLSPDAYRERDTAILKHVGRYGIGLIDAISRVIGGGKQLGHVVRRLADTGLLQLQSRALEGGVSYCRLTDQGASLLQVPKDRATSALGAQALDKAIAVATWCCLSTERRHKVERREFEELFSDGRPPTNQVHCVTSESGRLVVYRVQLVQGGHEPVVKGLERELTSLAPSVYAATESRQFGFALLVDSEMKRKSIESTVNRSGLRARVPIRVDLSATAKTIAAYLRAERQRECRGERT
jgi:hypothetical protein